MNSNYSTIRYHIYKELYKYFIQQEKNKVSFLNQFSISLFAGLAVTLAAPFVGCSIRNLLFILVGYWVILCLSLYIVRIFKYLRISFFPRKKFCMLGVTEEEVYAAKFNYEITYLVTEAYSQMLDLSTDPEMKKFQLVEVIFNLKNSLRKINESLIQYSKGRIGEEYILPTKLEIVFNMIHLTMKKLQNESTCSDELNSLEDGYSTIRKELEKIYGIDFAK